MPAVHSTSALTPLARFPRLLSPRTVNHLGVACLRVADAPVAPGTLTFVQIDVGSGVAFGLSVVAGPVCLDGSQLLTACSDDDRAIIAVAAQVVELERARSSPLWTPPPLPITRPSRFVAFPEVPRVP